MEEKHNEKLCCQIMDLMNDALKWKKIAVYAENEQERTWAREIAEALHTHYKKAHEYLMRMFAE